MGDVVRFPESSEDEDPRPSLEIPEDPEDEQRETEAELFILNLYRSRAHHPAGSKLPTRRAE